MNTRCEDQPFILKPVSESRFKLSQELRKEYRNSQNLRTHVDDNVEERVLIYEAYTSDLLYLIRGYRDLGVKQRKFILREIAQGLKELHDKNWVHLDVKPNNIMLDWSLDEAGEVRIDRVALADMESAMQLRDDQVLDAVVGNLMWRSPEGQLGRGVCKPSEMFSFGLVCLFTMTGIEVLQPDWDKLDKAIAGTDFGPEHIILEAMIRYFGPVPDGLLERVRNGSADHESAQILEGMRNAMLELPYEDERLEGWDEKRFPNLNSEVKRVLSRMLNFDPNKRATIDEILEDPWWK
ncbi:kinase-like protein [Xylariaceae sp. FL0662B]|nr:kinase-like protein [Xylariaceae sp. FL0662B]